jgi:transposase-like protein
MSKKLLQSARDMYCMECGRQDGTVVAAHRNEGKGMGMKVPDWQVAYLCHDCHYALDNAKDMTRDERRAMWNRCYVKTVDYWFRSGLVKVS